MQQGLGKASAAEQPHTLSAEELMTGFV